jgi:hypothetical protein
MDGGSPACAVPVLRARTRMNPKSNHSMQQTGASLSARLAFVAQRRLAPPLMLGVMRFYGNILIAVAALIAGCSRGPAKISLTNGSSVTVSNVQVAGEHFAQPLGLLTPGTSIGFTLSRASENNVWVTFEANGQALDSRGKGRPNFFEVGPRHPLSLTIGTDLNVVSSNSTKSQ